MTPRGTLTRGMLACACLAACAAWAQLPAVRCERPPVSVPRAGAGDATGSYEPSVADYEEALRREPRTAQEHFNHGVLHERMGQYASAIRDYTGAVDLDPCYAPAYERRGAALASLNQFERAIGEFGLALALDPKYAVAYLRRGESNEAAGHADSALADFTEALRINPRFRTARTAAHPPGRTGARHRGPG